MDKAEIHCRTFLQTPFLPMKNTAQITGFLFRAIIAGLAVAFVAVYLWPALANRKPPRNSLFYILAGLFFVAWLICCHLWYEHLWPGRVLVLSFLPHLAMAVCLTLVSSGKLIEARRTGELELLLVTPLDRGQIIHGQMVSLKRRFLGPFLVLLAFDLNLLFFIATKGNTWPLPDYFWVWAFGAGMVMFMADLYTCGMVGLWRGLMAISAPRAMAQTLGLVLLMPFLFYLVSLPILLPMRIRDLITLTAWWLASGLAFRIGLCCWASYQLQEKLHPVAARAR